MNPSLQATVLIGRFQPWHNGHAALLREALTRAPRVVIVLGSAHQARSPRNPFTWTERAEMIRLTLSEADNDRVHFLPLRDHYDDVRWTAAVRSGVEALLGLTNSGAEIALIGHFKDATSDYLRRFAPWQLVSLPRQHAADALTLRDAVFGADDSEAATAALAALVDQMPATTRAFWRAWVALPHFSALQTEWQMLRAYRAAWSGSPYPPVFVTVDAVLQCADHVLLIQRGQHPGKGLWALPGGFIEPRETAYQSCLRELTEETNLHLLPDTLQRALRGTRCFDHPDRSQRGRTITHAHHFDLGQRELPEVKAGDDAAQTRWVPLAELPTMEASFMDDHFHILDSFIPMSATPGTARSV